MMRTGGTSLAPQAAYKPTMGGRKRLQALGVLYEKGRVLLTAPNLLLAVAGYLLGRATILGEVAPFGIIFWLLVLREKPQKNFLVATAVLIGRGGAYGWPSALYLLGAMVVLWLLEGLWLHLFRGRCPLVPAAAVLLALSRYPSVLSLRLPLSLDGVLVLLEMVIGLLAVVVLQPGVRLAGCLPRSRDRPLPRPLEQEEMMAVFLLFVFALLGLKGVMVGRLSVEAVVSMLCLLGIAYLAGAGWGAATGIITGTILGLGNPHFYLTIGSLSFGGFWAGLLRGYGRWVCTAGFIFSLPVLYLLAPGEMPGIDWREGLLSLVIFLALPSHWLEALSRQFLRAGLQGTEEAVGESTRRQVARRMYLFAGIFRELAADFSRAATGNGSVREDEPYPLLENLMNRVCRSCLFRQRCWEKDLYSHHRLILDLLARAEVEGKVGEAHLPPAFRERCHQPGILVEAVNNLKEVWAVNRFWERRVKEGQELVAGQLAGISTVLEELAGEVEADPFPTGVGEQTPLYNLELGLAQKAGHNQQVCGDHYSFIELDPGREAIILSDGMGKGPQAAEESKAATRMLELLLEAGLPKELVLRTANSLLQLRSGEDSFATVDLAVIDLREGAAELIKLGAAPGYLKKRTGVLEIGASSLPLGILSSLEAESHLVKLSPADLLVMATDGVADPDGDTAWLGSLLEEMDYSPPQVAADRIVEEVTCRSGGCLRDDLTVIACRLMPLRTGRPP